MKPSKTVSDRLGRKTISVMDGDDEMSAPTHEAIARLAHSYWEARGGHGGSAWEDWFRAEQELFRRKEL